MQKLNLIKRIKLIVLTFVAAIFFACLPGGQTTANREQEQPRRTLELVPTTAPLETRAGTDDGAAFAIQFIGSTHGNLESCGCAPPRLGGLVRRASYEKLFKAKVGGIPVIVVDSGNSFANEVNAHGALRPDLYAKDDWILKSYDEIKVDAINIAALDLHYISTILTKSEFARRADVQPAIKRLISANTVSDSPNAISPQPFIVREFPARAAGAKPARVALVGLTEPSPTTPHGFKISDPVEAARRVVPEARRQADVVIVLGYLNSEAASRLAAQVPGIDAIIVANSQSDGAFFTPPLTVGQTLILFTSYETRMLGELRVYRDASDKYSMRTRFISLDPTFPEDAVAAQLVNAAGEAEKDTRRQSKKLLEGWLEASRTVKPAVGGAAAYSSSKACAQCHEAQYIHWANSGHAHATDKLPPRWIEFEAGCLSCHATGQRTAADGKIELAKLQSVQCEQCHGPGSEHIQKPGKGYGRISNEQAMCATCHTREVSPNFDFQSAWAKIKH